MPEELEELHAVDEPSTPEVGAGRPEPRWKLFLNRRNTRIALLCCLVLPALCIIVASVFYLKFAKITDARLAAGAFGDTINIYSAPQTVAVGDPLTLREVLARLRRAGYTTSRGNGMGWYNVRGDGIEIFPGRDAYAGGESGVIEFQGDKVSRIVSLQDNTERKQFELEPQLLANLSRNREKRHLVRFNEIPPALVHAVISAEDKHFFHHTGFDLFRIGKAAYVDLKDGRKEQGASTLTMQLARGLWLDSEKRWRRKLEELLITMHLEHKLNKQKIFEYYANQVYLGRRGPFSINGFGEGAHAYFDKDLSQLTNAEAATLAGMVQRPSYFNPYRNPDRVRERRDLVLTLMRQNGYLTQAEYDNAAGSPLKVQPPQSETMASQYFVDLMIDELQNKLEEGRSARYVYTTLDPELQAAAEEAVRDGMKGVDQLLHGKKGKAAKAKDPIPPGQPQVALIALDPHTGEIKALVGGRDYGSSQLNHVLAMRQPGSAFKPFVYATALETGVIGGQKIFTPASVVNDSPTDFAFNGRLYSPSNFKHEFMGQVTLRTALAHSLNVGTVALAQAVGYSNVVAMAHRAGLNEAIKPTPAVALGAYETTPLEIAGAYTLFANRGMHVTPTTLALVRGADGTVLEQHTPDSRQALDPRVAYLMVNMMQEVLRSGTGASVRSKGFTLPAAGKTGTSRDGWFAGFTSELLCVVWVGFDDNRELNLEGAHSALPIWTEFMKKAAQTRPYRDAKQFQAPAGVATAEICSESGQLAGANCPNVRSEVFIDGTQPVVECQLHSAPQVNYADRVMEMPASSTPAANPNAPAPWWSRPATATAPSSVRPAAPAQPAGGWQN
jgi:penicillin-binding protein 1B